MSDNKFKGPTYRYGPNGEGQVFNHSDDVPEGWLDDPTKHEAPAKQASEAAPAQPDMTRKEIVAALQSGGLQFDARANVATLYAQLTEAVKKALADSGVDPVPDLPTKQLLELLPAPE
jgi:hypothetical protein